MRRVRKARGKVKKRDLKRKMIRRIKKLRCQLIFAEFSAAPLPATGQACMENLPVVGAALGMVLIAAIVVAIKVLYLI